MKKLVALLLVLLLAMPVALADTWFPFGLTAEDDLQSASDKLVKALPEISFSKKTVSTYAMNASLYMGDVTFKNITLIKNSDALWRLILQTGSEIALSDYLKDVYGLYTSLAEQCGKPTDTQPKIVKRAFDGSSTEIDIFSDVQTFIGAIQQNIKGEVYKAQFGNFCNFRCEMLGYGQMTVVIEFENYGTT